MRKTPAPLSAPFVKPTAKMPTLEKKLPLKVTASAKTLVPKAMPVKAPAAKSTPAPAAKSTPAPAAKSTPAPATRLTAKTPAAKPVKVIAETPATYFAGVAGRAWRMSGKHAVAYVHTAALAGELLQTEPRQVAGSAMAIYYDRKGRPFAWQFRFDTARWAEVTGRLL